MYASRHLCGVNVTDIAHDSEPYSNVGTAIIFMIFDARVFPRVLAIVQHIVRYLCSLHYVNIPTEVNKNPEGIEMLYIFHFSKLIGSYVSSEINCSGKWRVKERTN